MGKKKEIVANEETIDIQVDEPIGQEEVEDAPSKADTIPELYAFLLENVGEIPIMLQEALALYGTEEAEGKANNETILAWASELGGWQGASYNADSIPWCGLFMAFVAKSAGVEMPTKMVWLRAKDWARFGDRVAQAGLGDTLVFSRKGGGHVGLYVSEDATHYHVLGGNQGDKVQISRISKDRLADIRRPKEHAMLASVKPYIFEEGGAEETTNEE